MKIERLAGVLQGVQDQIRFCDTKAQVILGLNGILAGFLATRASELASTIAGESRHVIAVGLFLSVALYLVFLVSSFAFGVRVVLPRLDVSQPDSCVFFSHIAAQHKNNYEKIAKELPGLSDEDLAADMAKQILANSHVCVRKHQSLRNSWVLTTLSAACWVSTWLFLFASAFHISPGRVSP